METFVIILLIINLILILYYTWYVYGKSKISDGVYTVHGCNGETLTYFLQDKLGNVYVHKVRRNKFKFYESGSEVKIINGDLHSFEYDLQDVEPHIKEQ